MGNGRYTQTRESMQHIRLDSGFGALSDSDFPFGTCAVGQWVGAGGTDRIELTQDKHRNKSSNLTSINPL